jgi:hypothetical protein
MWEVVSVRSQHQMNSQAPSTELPQRTLYYADVLIYMMDLIPDPDDLV